MIVSPIKTHKITTEDKDILEIVDKYLICHSGALRQTQGKLATESSKKQQDPISRSQMENSFQDDSKTILQENSVVAVTSKIISLTEGRVAPLTANKENLIQEEADLFLPRSSSKYDVQFTIKNNILAASAGVDESNADNQYVLWPKDVQACANKIREHLATKFNLRNIGVIITDSKTTPLRWGVTGIALAHSGFAALKDYIGQEDLFGRKFNYEKLNIADTLASAAIAVMGEGAEQTPLAVISDVPFADFQGRNPTEEELQSLIISPEDDLFAPLLTGVQWKKGKNN